LRKIKKEIECHSCGKEIIILEDILCNKCGKTCKIYIDREHKHYNYEGLRATVHAGFGSSLDGLNLKFDLCDNCLIGLIKDFRIPFEAEEYDLFEGGR